MGYCKSIVSVNVFCKEWGNVLDDAKIAWHGARDENLEKIEN
jgi:hypothetical protein